MEYDTNDDDELDDIVVMSELKIGDYLITIIAPAIYPPILNLANLATLIFSPTLAIVSVMIS